MLFTRWIIFTEELLELAYRNGLQCNGCVRTPFTDLGLQRACDGAARRNFRQIKGLIPPR
jgi:hypothetical protein